MVIMLALGQSEKERQWIERERERERASLSNLYAGCREIEWERERKRE